MSSVYVDTGKGIFIFEGFSEVKYASCDYQTVKELRSALDYCLEIYERERNRLKVAAVERGSFENFGKSYR